MHTCRLHPYEYFIQKMFLPMCKYSVEFYSFYRVEIYGRPCTLNWLLSRDCYSQTENNQVIILKNNKEALHNLQSVSQINDITNEGAITHSLHLSLSLFVSHRCQFRSHTKSISQMWHYCKVAESKTYFQRVREGPFQNENCAFLSPFS